MKNQMQSLSIAKALRIGIIICLLTLLLVAFVKGRGGAVLALIGFILLMAWLSPGPSKTHGSAALARRFDLNDAGYFEKRDFVFGRAMPERTPLGRSSVDLCRAPWSDSESVVRHFAASILGRSLSGRPLLYPPRYCHGTIVGPPGSGKTAGFVLTNLLTHRGSIVVTDPKGELFAGSAARRQQFGQVYRLDPFGLCGPNTDGFNPLGLLDPHSDRLINDANSISQAIVIRNPQEHEQHFSDNAEVAITGAILYVVTAKAPRAEKNLVTVRRLLADPQAFQGMIADMSNRPEIAGGAMQSLSLQMSGWVDRELGSIMSTANRHLAWVDAPVCSRCLTSSSFDPIDFVRSSCTLYLILPPDQLVPLSRLTRLWVTMFIARLTQFPAQEKRTVLLLLDEAAAMIGRLPALQQAITLLRSFGIRVWLILQALSQLQQMFPEEKSFQTIQANMGHIIAFGIRDLETAQFLAAFIGTATVQTVSTQKSTGRSDTPFWSLLFGQKPNSGSSD